MIVPVYVKYLLALHTHHTRENTFRETYSAISKSILSRGNGQITSPEDYDIILWRNVVHGRARNVKVMEEEAVQFNQFFDMNNAGEQ